MGSLKKSARHLENSSSSTVCSVTINQSKQRPTFSLQRRNPPQYPGTNQCKLNSLLEIAVLLPFHELFKKKNPDLGRGHLDAPSQRNKGRQSAKSEIIKP